MAMIYATITGTITRPGSNVGVRARITATPLTTNQALTFTGDDRITVGPETAETNGSGTLATLKIPTNVDVGGLLWRITAEALDRSPGPSKWVVKNAVEITGSGIFKLKDLVEVDVVTLDAAIVTNISDLVTDATSAKVAAAGSATAASGSATNAASSASAAAGSATAASGSATAASGSAGNASTKAGEAASSASAAAGSATAAASSASHADAMAGATAAVAVSNDTIIAGRINDSASATATALTASTADIGKTLFAPTGTTRRSALPRIVSLISGTEDEAPTITNGTLTVDTTNYAVGGRAHKMSMASATSATLSLDPLPGPTDPVVVPPFQTVCLEVYVPDITKITEIGIYLYTDSGLTNGARWTRRSTTSPTWGLVNGWNTIRIPTDFDTQTSGGFTQNLYRASVYATTNAATEVTVGHLYLECQTKARVLFVADRGYKSFYDNGYPALKALKVPVTWAIDVTLQGSGSGSSLALTEAQIDAVAAENRNSISFHGWDGSPTSGMTAAQLRADTMKSIKYLQGKGYTGRMWRAAFVQNAAPQYAAISDLVVGAGHGTGVARPTAWPPLDMMVVPRNALDNDTTTTASIDARFAWLQRTHMMEVVYIHGVGAGQFDASQSLFDYYVSKLQEGIEGGWLEAVTFEELYENSGGDFIVSPKKSLQAAGALSGRTPDAPVPTAAPRADVQVFGPSVNTWVKPTGAKAIRVVVIGAGGGGGSGRRGAAGSIRVGGGGGGGGAVTEWTLDASVVGASETVTVGNGGIGGAAVTVDSTSGNAGTAGGGSSFGSHATATGGGGGAAGGAGTGGTGGFNAAGRWDSGGGGAASSAGTVGAAGVSASSSSPGGGGGGGITAADIVSGGGAGKGSPGRTSTAGAAGAAGADGGTGTSTPTGSGQIGASGGGGGASITAAAGAGGDAGLYGAGGGGGGASLNGNNSGKGGNGAPGTVVVITYF